MEKELKELIVSLMKQKTGTHFLDSGGKDGRHWQQNLDKEFDFANTFDFTEDDCWINIHMFMYESFELDENTNAFNELLSEDYYWTEEAFNLLKEDYDIEKSEYIGEGNSYNYDNDLSQVFQWYGFTYQDNTYVIFQLHNGADVRGGYTSSVVFKLNDDDCFHRQEVYYYENEQGQTFTKEEVQDFYKEGLFEIDIENQKFINLETGNDVHPSF